MVSGSATFAGTVTITSNTGNGGHIRGPASGGVLHFTGPQVQTVGATSIVIRDGFVRFAGGGSYSSLAIGAGTTSLGAHDGISVNAVIDLGASGNTTLDLNGWNQTLAGLTRTNHTTTVRNNTATPSTLTMALGAATQAFDGLITGNLHLAVSSCTFQLANPHTFTGGASLSGGTLRINGQLSSSGVNATGGTLGGIGTITGASAIHAGAVLSPGEDAIGTLQFNNALSLAGGRYKAEFDSSTQDFDQVRASDLVTLGDGAQLTLTDRAVSNVALPVGTKRAILDYTAGSLSGTFAGLPEGATVTTGANLFAIHYADTGNGLGGSGKFITLTAVGAIGGYADWAAAFNAGAFDDDSDHDGLKDGLEWILGGNPLTSDAAGRIASVASANEGLTLTFRRDTATATAVELAVEWSTDPALGWPNSLPIGSNSFVGEWNEEITVSGDEVTVFIPSENAPEGRIFARLNATAP